MKTLFASLEHERVAGEGGTAIYEGTVRGWGRPRFKCAEQSQVTVASLRLRRFQPSRATPRVYLLMNGLTQP